MNPVSLLVAIAPAVFVLCGYATAARLTSLRAAQRLAVASLTGLLLLLANLSVAALAGPVTLLPALLCLWPVALTLGGRTARAALLHDLRTVFLSRRGLLALTAALGALLLLAWPELSRADLLYFDGTANHDGYFWITGAKHLQAHSYLTISSIDAAHPWANYTRAFCGWRPEWGRAGAESLLALAATLAAVDPVAIYLPLLTALFVPWVAVVYLVARTFWIERLSPPALLALILLQPLFFFFRANGNLPNLLGILAGGTLVVAVAAGLDGNGGRERAAWCLVIVLAAHGLLFSYPEMVPFIALPCALLLGRAWIAGSPPDARRTALLVSAAGLIGCAINPATAIRAIYGFMHALAAGRADSGWANLFARIDAAQYTPSFATLSVPAMRYLGPGFGLAASGMLLAAGWLAIARARDRFGALASLSGGALLLAYTITNDFDYGWQKTTQFSAVFIAAVLPVAALHLAATAAGRRFQQALAAGVAALFVTTLVFHTLELRKWTQRKALTTDWLELEAYAHAQHPGAPVLVEPATFAMSFFDGMWAAYYLREHPLVYAARGRENGGYVRDSVAREPAAAAPADAPVLVSRSWADTFDANSPRDFSSERVVLLRRANRVTTLTGVTPTEGVPQFTACRFAIALRPHSPSTLRLTLSPADADTSSNTNWQITRSLGEPLIVSGPPPWQITLPLTAGVLQRFDFAATSATAGVTPARFKVDSWRIDTVP